MPHILPSNPTIHKPLSPYYNTQNGLRLYLTSLFLNDMLFAVEYQMFSWLDHGKDVVGGGHATSGFEGPVQIRYF